MVTASQVKAAVLAAAALAEAIRAAGQIPSGVLYAQVMQHMSLETYQSFIDRLVGAGLVRCSGHLLTWVGPTIIK